MEREVLVTGIGGQGIQLTSKVLAQAASQEGRNVMLFGVYGGMIRGGPSDCTLVASTEEILAPPIIEEAWGLLALHPGSLPALLSKIRPGGFVLSNSTLVANPIRRTDLTVVEVPATRIAEEAGRIVGAGMVAIGAFISATGFLRAPSVLEAMRVVIPPHRESLLELNRRCLELGSRYIEENLQDRPIVRAWEDGGTAAAAV